jgi:NTE family protein
VDFTTREPVPNSTRRLTLTDGGVYDNLGLQPVDSFHSVLVSDGGAPSVYSHRPYKDWLSQSLRTLRIIDSQVRSLRRRHLVQDYLAGARLGALWTISAALDEYPLADPMPVAKSAVAELANVPTRLCRMEPRLRKRLINWGYAATDAAVRSYVEPSFPPPAGWPFPEEPLD